METKKAKKADIERFRGIFFECGLAVGLFFLIVAFSWSSSGQASIILQGSAAGEIVDDIDIINTTQDDPPPPQEIVAPVVTDDLVLVDNTMEITGAVIFNTEDNKTPVFETVYVPKKEQVKETTFVDDFDISVVQEPPTMWDGGDANSFSKWVASRIVYPTVDLENGVQGKVILQFRISPDGTLEKIKVLRGISPGLDREAVRVVSTSLKWNPGKHNGKPAGVIYTFPVNFVITAN